MNNHTDVAVEPELVDELILQQMIKDTCAEIMPTLIEHYKNVSPKGEFVLVVEGASEKDRKGI